MLIGILNRKGGCGKSTTVVHLAYWLAKKQQRVIVIDADGQISASQWLETLNLPAIAVSTPDELIDQAKRLSGQYDVVLVDPPAGLGDMAKAVVMSVDVLLVPVQPSNLDLLATKDTLYLINQIQKFRKGVPRVAMFLSRAAKGTVLLRETQDVLAKTAGITLLKTLIYQRQAIADSPGQHATVFNLAGDAAIQASNDYETLFEEVLNYSRETNAVDNEAGVEIL